MSEQVTYISEIMAQPQEFFWLPWAVQYFFLSVSRLARHFMLVTCTGKVRVKIAD